MRDGLIAHLQAMIEWCHVYRQFIHPGNGVEAARAWVAPRAGTIDIASTPAKADPGGQGVVVRITKNGATIAGPRTIAAADGTGSAFDVRALDVVAGVRIQRIDTFGYRGSDQWQTPIVSRLAAADRRALTAAHEVTARRAFP